MKIAIISCGRLGATAKAAGRLKEFLVGHEVDIFDGKDAASVCGYDVYVLGTNIRFGKFSKSFRKAAKRLRGQALYVYISGADIEKARMHIENMKSAVPEARSVRHVWGELNVEGTRGFTKFAIQSTIEGRHKDKLPPARILDKELRALAADIEKN
ncbi:MAG: hypothetical protein E7350_00625 [Clostridiales bacterium]|nr:hypothetical protein [Clostridiales bacterium]